jgi:hypothetical protein
MGPLGRLGPPSRPRLAPRYAVGSGLSGLVVKLTRHVFDPWQTLGGPIGHMGPPTSIWSRGAAMGPMGGPSLADRTPIRDAICGHAPRSTAESYEHATVEDTAEAPKRFPRYTVATPCGG